MVIRILCTDSSSSFRHGLLSSVAIGALTLVAPSAALAQIVPPDVPCNTVAGTTVTCTGNVSSGIVTAAPYSVLNVNTLTAGITPAAGTDGIRFSSSGAVTVNIETGPYSIQVSGAGAAGIRATSSSGAVTVDSTGAITSTDDRGIHVSSSGAGAVSVTNDGAIQAKFYGIFAYAATGAVTVDSTGAITSSGGSGIWANNSGAGAVSVTNDGAIQSKLDGIRAYTATGAVTVDTTGAITSSDGPGIRAQNSGAGAVSVTNDGAIQARFEGIRASSQSGAVTVDTTGAITSSHGHGIEAQNSGAGAVSVTSVGNIQTGNEGIRATSSSGAVTVDSTGTITATNGRGINAQNSGADAVSVTNDGPIEARNEGIYTRSLTGGITIDASGDIASTNGAAIRSAGGSASDIILRSGNVHGATGGVVFDGGGANALWNYAGLSAGTWAVSGTTGDEAVSNFGVITGNVDLGGGNNDFMNGSGGLFNMGASVILGTGDILTNSGALSPGGTGTVASTAITGNLVQTTSGRMNIDVDSAGSTADLINITGTATLAGTVAVNALNPGSTEQNFTIISAAGGTIDNGLAVAGGSAIPITFWLLYPNANDVVLSMKIDFAGPIANLNPNQTALGNSLNDVVNTGTGGVAPVIGALLNITDPTAYRNALNQLLPEHYLHLQSATRLSANDFSQSLMSCRVRKGGFAFIAEGQCVWSEVGSRRFDLDTTANQVGSDDDSHSISAGAQLAVAEKLRFGFAARYENVDQMTGNFARSDGDRGHIGVALKYSSGPVLLAGAVSAGRSWYDTDRQFAFNGFTGMATSNHEVDYVNSLVRAAYLIPLEGGYAKPVIDFNVTRVDSSGFTEGGGAGAGLTVSSTKDTVFSVSQALEIGAEWRLSTGALVRPFLRAGATFYDDANIAVTSLFSDAPGGDAGFVTAAEVDKVMGDVTVGLDIFGASGVDVRLNYDGSFGETTAIQSFGGRAGVKF